MTKDLIIERTLAAIKQLPMDKAQEISDFADFIVKKHEAEYGEDKHEARQLLQGIHALTSSSKAFHFLAAEEDMYSLADAKEVYDEKR